MKGSRKSTDLDAGGVRPADLFKADVQYRVPVFQRHYVWQQHQFDLLWSDLGLLQEDGGEIESRFLGAIVLEDQGRGLATDPDEYVIVDGQQRLLTLYLLLVAIAQDAHSQHSPAAKTFAGDLVRQWLINQGSKIAGEAKVTPTLADFAQFRSVMQAVSSLTSVTLPTSYGPVEGRLTSMFERIRSKIGTDALTAEGVTGRVEARLDFLERLANAVLNRLQFVEIILGEDDDPHHVFDRLNDAGVKLQVADLVRNDVFQRMVGSPSEADKLHANQWTPFEASLNGRLEDFVFPYALIRDSGTTKGRMMADLRRAWEGWDSKAVIADLSGYVSAFNAVVNGQWSSKEPALPKGLLSQVERLSRMPVPSSVYSYAMMVIREAAAGRLSESDATRDLLLVESFLVRRALAGFEPTGLHSLFKTMWGRTLGAPNKLVAEIDARPNVRFPDNKQFESDIRTRPLYGRRLAGYILAEFDRSLPGDPTPSLKPTIDHVMPRKPSSAWSVSAVDHKRVLHVWGNLVPLSGPSNSSKNNGAWTAVEKRLLAESAFKTPRDLALRYRTWGPKQVDQRSTELVTWAVARWPRA